MLIETPAAAVAPAVPNLPSRYEPVRLLAAGGTATVWCAEDRLLGRRVAIKILATSSASDPEAVRRFMREGRAAARLSGHPNVVMIFDVDRLPAPAGGGPVQPFLVMEHLAGGTVADALRHRALSLDDAMRWLLEAASALDYAHANGILHRDVKPANLLLDLDRVLHVADFGIAQIGRSDDHATRATRVIGTASYLAPERALGQPASAASDIYSLGVAAFELLTGELPFTASSYLALARQHIDQAPPRASKRDSRLPRAIDTVLDRALAKAPEQRWPSAMAFAAALSEVMAPAVDVRGGQAAAIARARRMIVNAAAPSGRARHRRASLGLLAGAGASLALMAGGLVWAAGGSKPPLLRDALAPAAPLRTSGPATRAPRPRPVVLHSVTTTAAPTPPPATAIHRSAAPMTIHPVTPPRPAPPAAPRRHTQPRLAHRHVHPVPPGHSLGHRLHHPTGTPRQPRLPTGPGDGPPSGSPGPGGSNHGGDPPSSGGPITGGNPPSSGGPISGGDPPGSGVPIAGGDASGSGGPIAGGAPPSD